MDSDYMLSTLTVRLKLLRYF